MANASKGPSSTINKVAPVVPKWDTCFPGSVPQEAKVSPDPVMDLDGQGIRGAGTVTLQ